MTRPILYISGPYSAGNGRTVADNIAVARRYAVAAARKGWMPFTPHLNTAHFEVDCPEGPNEDWIDGDLAILRLLPRARAAVLLQQAPQVEALAAPCPAPQPETVAEFEARGGVIQRLPLGACSRPLLGAQA